MIWQQNELDTLKMMYPDTKTEVIAKKLNRSVRSVYSMAHIMNLVKSDEFRKGTEGGIWRQGKIIGVEHRFKKGLEPHNKGRKQKEYMSKANQKKCAKTQFRKGNEPHNTKHDKAITLRNDASAGKQYYHIRIAKAKWVSLHNYLYEQKHGKIPKGHIVIFKDNNPLNCVIENLELISRKEHMLRNSIQRYPEEIKDILRIKSKLNKTISKLQNNG